MDLFTVMKKLKDYVYRFVEDCLDDIDLIWENCLKYNRPTDVIMYAFSGYQKQQGRCGIIKRSL